MAKEELFDTAFRDATAFACLCSERAISRNMEAESAKAFINKLYSLVARRCAGLFGLTRTHAKLSRPFRDYFLSSIHKRHLTWNRREKAI